MLPGFHPDPSICRVGQDYYLVTSSFEWFPGLPVHHSRDLVDWRPIGHVIDRPSQLDYRGIGPSRGLFAPTIRHHEGVFYVVCTMVDGGGNFLVTAEDPAGPWSDPHWLPETAGIDPSLLFDEGRAWLHGTREKQGGAYPGDTEIWLRELDLATLRPVGEEHVIWDVEGAIWTEGPHLYRVDGAYHLLTAEGGTDVDHAVMAARSARITGPYEACPGNPVLTHRHLGRTHPVTGTGHADLVQTEDGDWWAVLLAMRPYGGYHYNLGRETFVTRVTWADGWPLLHPLDRHFGVRLAPCWNHPHDTAYTLRDGRLTIEHGLVARRQQHVGFTAETAVDLVHGAGLILLQNREQAITLGLHDDHLRLTRAGEVLATARVSPGRVQLGVDAEGQDYRFRHAPAEGPWTPIGEPVDGRLLSSTVAGGFTGAYLGMYAEEGPATFAWFDYWGT